MVDGLEMTKTPCAVIDLDGTVIKGNSMHEMIRYMLRKALLCGDAGTFFGVMRYLLLRKLGVVTHREMKHPIHVMAEKFMLRGGRLEELVEVIMGMVNTDVTDVIADLSNRGYKILLATAAPDVYVREIAGRLSANGCICTLGTEKIDDYIETKGVEKLRRVSDYAIARGWEIRCVITDHSDDMPLLALPDVERVLVNPDKELCADLRLLKLAFSVIR